MPLRPDDPNDARLPDRPVPVAVAIPARDEAERIGACLAAVGRALRGIGPASIVVLADRCGDDTADLARIWGSTCTPVELRLDVVEDATGRDAGTARARAAALARARVGPDGAILITDADSQPGPGWATGMLGALRGADLACGPVRLERPPEGWTGAVEVIETEALRLQARAAALIDPDPGNPWPHHLSISGASLALKAEAYDALGGLPATPRAEDRALVQAALDRDMAVRFAPVAEVVTSSRLDGRAGEGLAATLAERSAAEDPLCDERLMPLPFLLTRCTIQRRLRETGAGPWLRAHGVEPSVVAPGAGPGTTWAAIRDAAPHLSAPRLRLSEVRAQMPALRRLVARLEPLAGLSA